MIHQIEIITIPHSQQRYNTVGDWQFRKSTTEDGVEKLIISVSDTGREEWNFLIARHELDEAFLCRSAGVTTKQVDDYDFTSGHTMGPDCPLCKGDCECGGDNFSALPDSPYYFQHNHALASEWQMAQLLGVDWREYSAKVNELMRSYGDNK